MPQTNFTSSRHGWPFPNSFTYSPHLIGLRRVSLSFGFCGGMCRTAVIRYRRGEPIPRGNTAPPEQGCELYDEILREQKIAMREGGTWPKVLAWMWLPDHGRSSGTGGSGHSLAHLVRGEEWPALRDRLDREAPSVLCLIRNRRVARPTDNHMVVASRYDIDPSTGLATVGIYDPNHPDADDVSISFKLEGPSLEASQTTGEDLRGFFLISHAGLDD